MLFVLVAIGTMVHFSTFELAFYGRAYALSLARMLFCKDKLSVGCFHPASLRPGVLCCYIKSIAIFYTIDCEKLKHSFQINPKLRPIKNVKVPNPWASGISCC